MAPDAFYSHALVASIEHHLGRFLHAAVREAFLRLPRHLFVPAYHEDGHHYTAPSPADEMAWDAWCRAINQDQALTTQVDARGLPTSSSSQPSLMALMLEALAVAPGQRVLEIGTGTGYHAALLATLVGDPHLVTTIDLDPALVLLAARAIEQAVGPGMSVEVGNGLDGFLQHAPYDRIIATGSAFPVPPAWIAQLRPQGKLVMDLRGRLSGGILLAQKEDEHQMTGQFLPEAEGMSFMRLRATVEEMVLPVVPREAYQRAIHQHLQLDPTNPAWVYAEHLISYEQFHEQLAGWNDWLQWTFPGLSITWRGQRGALHAVLFDASTQTLLTIEPGDAGIAIVVRGERALWSDIVQCAQEWEYLGRPGKASATWQLDQQGQQRIHVQHQGKTHTLVLTVSASLQ